MTLFKNNSFLWIHVQGQLQNPKYPLAILQTTAQKQIKIEVYLFISNGKTPFVE